MPTPSDVFSSEACSSEQPAVGVVPAERELELFHRVGQQVVDLGVGLGPGDAGEEYGDMTELRCSMVAAAGLASLTDGLIVDGETGDRRATVRSGALDRSLTQPIPSSGLFDRAETAECWIRATLRR